MSEEKRSHVHRSRRSVSSSARRPRVTVKMGRSDFMPPSPEKAKAKKRVSSTSPKKRRMKLSDFLFKGELGRGTYGSVFKALRRGKTKPYAIKVINMKGMTKKQLHDCSEEVRILSSLKNASIVKYLDSFVDAGKLYIVMEYVPNGTLYDFYKSKRDKAEENFVWATLVSLSLALQYIHGKKILHRDVKSTNVFLDRNLKVRLGDFGVAKVLGASKKMAKTVVGTPFYLSPELCQGRHYNDKSDIWALGIVMYELCMRTHPFVAESPIQLSQKIVGGKFKPVRGFSGEVATIIHKCLAVNPLDRPSAAEILKLAVVQSKARELGLISSEVAKEKKEAATAGGSPQGKAPKPSVTDIRKFKFESTIVGDLASGVQTKSPAGSPEAKAKDNADDKTLVRDLPLYPSTSDPIGEDSVLQAALPVMKASPAYHRAGKGGKGAETDFAVQLDDHLARARASCAEWVGEDELQELSALISAHKRSSEGSSDHDNLAKLFKEAHVLSPIIDPEALVTIYRLHNLEMEAKMV